MRLLLVLFLLMPSLAHAQLGDGVAVCCGRDDIGFRNNIPPLNSVRFGQQSLRDFSGSDRLEGRGQPSVDGLTPEPLWGLTDLEEGEDLGGAAYWPAPIRAAY